MQKCVLLYNHIGDHFRIIIGTKDEFIESNVQIARNIRNGTHDDLKNNTSPSLLGFFESWNDAVAFVDEKFKKKGENIKWKL